MWPASLVIISFVGLIIGVGNVYEIGIKKLVCYITTNKLKKEKELKLRNFPNEEV